MTCQALSTRPYLKEIEVLKAVGGGGGGRSSSGADAGTSGGGGEGEGGHPNIVSMLDCFLHQGAAPDGGGGGGGDVSASADSLGGRGGGGGGGEVKLNNQANFQCLVFELLSHSLYDVLQSTQFTVGTDG